jgi:hypothetical protein
MPDTGCSFGDYYAITRIMKHDIIDRDTGNIVGVISLSETAMPELLADLNLAHRLIKELQDRVMLLEQDMANITDKHC